MGVGDARSSMIPFGDVITVKDYVLFPDAALSIAGAHLLLLVRSWSKKRESTVDTPTSGLSASSTARLSLRVDAGSSGYLDPDALIVPVKKTDRNPFSQAVIVGRARNSDVVLESATVSKVHAYLTLSDDKSVLVKDCHSTNGTFVLLGSGPKRLADGETLQVAGGGELRFGTVDCMVVEASGLAQAVNYAVKSWTK